MYIYILLQIFVYNIHTYNVSVRVCFCMYACMHLCIYVSIHTCVFIKTQHKKNNKGIIKIKYETDSGIRQGSEDILDRPTDRPTVSYPIALSKS